MEVGRHLSLLFRLVLSEKDERWQCFFTYVGPFLYRELKTNALIYLCFMCLLNTTFQPPNITVDI